MGEVMDPNVMLREILALASTITSSQPIQQMNVSEQVTFEQTAQMLAEYVQELNAFFSAGGAYPTGWS